jgi:hypothetical protein
MRTTGPVSRERRHLLGTAAITAIAAQLGLAGSARGAGAPFPTVKPGTNTSFPALRQIDAGLLSVGAGRTRFIT